MEISKLICSLLYDISCVFTIRVYVQIKKLLTKALVPPITIE